MSSEELSDDQVSAIKEAFDLFASQEKTITKDQLAQVMRGLGQNPSETEIVDMINEIDVDGNGIIDFPEFLTLMARKIKDTDADSEMREAFGVFDKDHDGYISKEELKTLLQAIGENMADDEIQMLMDSIDTNGDGRIDEEEFIAILRAH
ncbi:uncharacterized protein SAPINGB_P003514 [Magnusiomyces paraingens]|uniref:EF-hand domain-containing protein n=1 Tax=Magnusiomyces paraingens TaxID=2606893 RepID=A0A5E8BQM3_9ASCO|nr:uncharacterized protein SAPINGB_P003514 [Saprochaete ingens]VVT53321.1 unnamed protein product [Saprochaete ingens]